FLAKIRSFQVVQRRPSEQIQLAKYELLQFDLERLQLIALGYGRRYGREDASRYRARFGSGVLRSRRLIELGSARRARANDHELAFPDAKRIARSRRRAARDHDAVASDRVCGTEIVNARAALVHAQPGVAFRDRFVTQADIGREASPDEIGTLADDASMKRRLARNRQTDVQHVALALILELELEGLVRRALQFVELPRARCDRLVIDTEDARRDEHDELGLAAPKLARLEELAQDRQRTQPRHLDDGLRVLRVE